MSLATVDVEAPEAAYRPAAHEQNVAPRPAVARDTPFIVLAAYNESATIHHVVLELTARYRNVVVVDDGSTDGTFALARAAGAVVLRHVVNRGQGAALQTGIEYSLARGAACIVTFDSDGQHRADDIPVLIEPIERGDCDIVLGSRFLGSTENMPRSRRWVLKAGVWFTRCTSGLAVTDAHNGLRAFSRRAAERIHITLDRMAHASELMDQIKGTGLPHTEVPVRIRYTDYSKAKGQGSSGAIKIVLHYLLGRALR